MTITGWSLPITLQLIMLLPRLPVNLASKPSHSRSSTSFDDKPRMFGSYPDRRPAWGVWHPHTGDYRCCRESPSSLGDAFGSSLLIRYLITRRAVSDGHVESSAVPVAPQRMQGKADRRLHRSTQPPPHHHADLPFPALPGQPPAARGKPGDLRRSKEEVCRIVRRHSDQAESGRQSASLHPSS